VRAFNPSRLDDDDNAHFARNRFPRAMMMMRGNRFAAEGPPPAGLIG
jgi:hypothetical protein